MTRALIFGAHGMLGQALVQHFEKQGVAVVAVDKDDCDITDAGAVRALVGDEEPDVVLSAAAVNAVDAIEQDPHVRAAADAVNGIAPGEIAQICNEHDIPFLHYSSDYVFAGDKQDGYSEDDVPTAPVNAYGETKLAGERAVQEVDGKYYIVRLSKLFGKPAISENAKKSFVDVMRWLVEEKGKNELQLVDEEQGSPSYAPDVAAFSYQLIVDDAAHGIYHAANDGACTWYGLAKETFDLLGHDVKMERVTGDAFPRPATRPMYSTLLNSKRPKQRNWQDALRAYLLEDE